MPNQGSGNLPNLLTLRKGYQSLNTEAADLLNLAAWHYQRIGNTGILSAPAEPASTQAIGSVPNPAATQRRVWLDEPPGSVPFDEQGALQFPFPAGFDVDVIVVMLTVPQGFDGVIKWISNNILNPSTPFGPGDLMWRIWVNGRPIRNFSLITVEKGTIAQGREISPIRIFSGDMVAYVVNQPAGSTLTGTTVCSLTGYYYPSKGIS